MSKLEEQKALPRRKLFKPAELVEEANMKIGRATIVRYSVRKAKKAKGKR